MIVEADESELEKDVNLTMESIQWLLTENVRAGTMALFWCLKSQLIKHKAKVFNKWRQNVLYYKFSHEKISRFSFSSRTGGVGHENSNAYSNQLLSRDQTEHIVKDTNARSERKLLMSLKRDYLRYEKETKLSQERKSESPDLFQDSIRTHSVKIKDLPSYMRGTVAVNSKYSTSNVEDHQIIRSITRSVSPTKDPSWQRSVSAGTPRHRIPIDDSPPGVIESGLSDRETRSKMHNRPPKLTPSSEHSKRNSNTDNLLSPSYDSVEAATPYAKLPHQNTISPIMSPLASTFSSSQLTSLSKQSLLETLNSKFREIAAKGYLDDSTVEAVLRNNESSVHRFTQNNAQKLREAYQLPMATASSQRLTEKYRGENDERQAENILKYDHSRVDFREVSAPFQNKILFPAPDDNHEYSNGKESSNSMLQTPLKDSRNMSSLRQQPIQERGRNATREPTLQNGFFASTGYRDLGSNILSQSSLSRAHMNIRGRSIERKVSKKKAWRFGKSMSPSPQVDSHSGMESLDKAQLKLLLSAGRVKESSRNWSASLRTPVDRSYDDKCYLPF